MRKFTEIDGLLLSGLHRALTARELMVFTLLAEVKRHNPKARKLEFNIKEQTPGTASEPTVCRGLEDLERRGLIERSFKKACRNGPPETFVTFNLPNIRALIDRARLTKGCGVRANMPPKRAEAKAALKKAVSKPEKGDALRRLIREEVRNCVAEML